MPNRSRITSFTNDGLTFDVSDVGPLDGEVVICLHGFPQPASSWDKVSQQLTDNGFRVLAPTQRGYSHDARPERRRDYTIDKLAGDVVALIDASGADRVHLVGHDWGAAVVWQVANMNPDRLASIVPVSTPHPRALGQSMLRSGQLLRSWYMVTFQLPWLPEKGLSLSNKERATNAFIKDGLTENAAAAAADLLTDPSAVPGMIGWYRALPLAGKKYCGLIDVPCIYIWGDRDHYLGRWAAEKTANWVTGPYRFMEIPEGTHWLPDSHPDQIADAIREIASEHPTR